MLPLAAFAIITAVFFLLALPLVRGRRKRQGEVFSAGRFRPLWFGPLTQALAGVIPCSASSRAIIDRDLRRAGYYHRYAFAEFAALRNAAALGWMTVIGTLIVVIEKTDGDTDLMLLAVGFFGALLFYGMPALILRAKANGRLQRIQYGLPDALDMITMCMTGGLPLQHALTRVSTEIDATHGDLARELKIVGRHIETGSLDTALDRFAQRIDTPDVQALAAMVRQTDMHGGGVANAFEQFGDGLRQSIRQRAEERGNKTSIKLLLPLVFCLAPPVYMLLLTPAVMELRNFVLRENRPGGILTPASLTAEANTSDRFSAFPFRRPPAPLETGSSRNVGP